MTNSESFFNQLKSERESQSIEISEICEFTKINSKYIEAIETGDFNLLPNVYMRLFLKAYANFIGADVEKALKDYELYTTGKIVQTKQNSTQIENKSPKSSIKSISKEIDSITQISSKQIFSGIFVILIILVFLWWASKVTKEQSNNIQSNKTSQSINEKSVTNSKANIVKSNIIIKNELPTVLKKNNLPNNSPLNENDFIASNKDSDLTKILNLTPPYNISITSLNKTKINISTTNNSKTTTLINKVISKGEEFIFEFSSIMNFEFWKGKDVVMKLNEIIIDDVNNNDLAIRGSYESNNSQLYISFYNY